MCYAWAHARGTGGFFSVAARIGAAVLKFGVPWLISTLAASLMAGWGKHWCTNELLSTCQDWLAENGGYYAAFFAVGYFLPKAENEQHEALVEMLITEVIDMAVRLSLLWLGSRVFVSKELGVAVGSTVADVLFALTLHHSHRLVEIVRLLHGRVFLSSRTIKTRFGARFGSLVIIGRGFVRPLAA